MWTIEPQQIWKKPRHPGISGFMRLKNEAAFLERTIESHLSGLDELVIVFNDCQDETPEICARWASRFPDKIKVFEYEPHVIPIGTPDSLTVDQKSPHCIANYYNYALCMTNRQIVIKIDGDHIAVSKRFNRICDRVRRNLPPKRRFPIYGLNITTDQSGYIGIYNYYDFSPQFTGERTAKKGPPPFTSGDQAFYWVDETSWHTVDPIEGFEVMDLSNKPRADDAAMTYTFFHMKGMKPDRGTANWSTGTLPGEPVHLRAAWVKNVMAPDPEKIVSIEAMRRHNPLYFRGARPYRELKMLIPEHPAKRPVEAPLPRLGLRDRLADLWYRAMYL